MKGELQLLLLQQNVFGIDGQNTQKTGIHREIFSWLIRRVYFDIQETAVLNERCHLPNFSLFKNIIK